MTLRYVKILATGNLFLKEGKKSVVDYQKLYSYTKDLSILIVEDYEPVRRELVEMFEDIFVRVSAAKNGEEAFSLYKHSKKEDRGFDIIITDIQMPQMDGIAFSKAVKNIDPSQMIAVLSAHSEAEYLLPLINEVGIAHFIPKPLKSEEVLDVLYHLCQKLDKPSDDIQDTTKVILGEGYTWDKEKELLYKDESSVELTRYELLFLKYFILRQNQICKSDEISHYFYNENIELSERSVRNTIFTLRKKLDARMITSVYGMGYRFTQLT
jgi:DNA-binding response OmpR family regulator